MSEKRKHSLYFFERNGKEFGPFSSSEIRNLAAHGQLNPNDLVRKLNGRTKTKASQIPNLQFSEAFVSKSSRSDERNAAPKINGTAHVVPIVRECQPSILRKKLAAVYPDRILLLSKIAVFNKHWELTDSDLASGPEHLKSLATSAKEILVSDLSRVVIAIMPRWLAGNTANVLVESSDGRKLSFRMWKDQTQGFAEPVLDSTFVRSFGWLTIFDVLFALLLMTQLLIGMIAGMIVAMASAATLSTMQLSSFGLGMQELFLLAFAITFSMLPVFLVRGVVSRACWTRFHFLASIPLLLIGIAAPAFAVWAIFNDFRNGESIPDQSELWVVATFVSLHSITDLYFPIRITFGDRLAPANSSHFRTRRKLARARKGNPIRNNFVGIALKFLGLAGMIAFWSPLTHPIFAWIEEHSPSVITAFYGGHFARIALTVGPAILLYAGYRLSQKKAIVKEGDPRKPILYLRPFSDDQATTMQPRSHLASLCGIDRGINAYGTQASERGSLKWQHLWTAVHPIRVVRLIFNRCVDSAEESLVRFFSRLAPVVAIGKPGEFLPTPGALRVDGGDDWQTTILEYLRECQAVIVQPGTSEGVVWELEQIRKRLPHYKVLLNLTAFRRDPEAYETLARVLLDAWGTSLPPSLPFKKSPCFIWLDSKWQPIIQELSYTIPLSWPFTGNTIDLNYTLQPFLQGMHGGDREVPRCSRWKQGVPYLMTYLPTALLALLVMFLPGATLSWLTNLYRSNVLNNQQIVDIPDRIASSNFNTGQSQESTVQELPEKSVIAEPKQKKYRGKDISFRFTLGADWTESSPSQEGLEYQFSKGSVGIIEIYSLGSTRLADLFDSSFGEGVRKNVEDLVKKKVPVGTVELVDDQWTEVNGVRWRALAMKQNYSVLLDEVRYSFYTAGPQGSIIVHLILQNNNQAPKLRDEFMAAFFAPSSDLDLLVDSSESGDPKLYRGSKSGLVGRLHNAWIPLNLEKSLTEMEEIGDSLREMTATNELVFQLGTEPKFGSLEIDVYDLEGGDFSPADFNQADCKALVQVREDAMGKVFDGKVEFTAKLLDFKVVRHSSRDWLELHVEQSIAAQGFQDLSFMVQRLARREDYIISVGATVNVKHPLIEEMISDALDAFEFEETR